MNDVIRTMARKSGIPVGLTGGNPSEEEITSFALAIIIGVITVVNDNGQLTPEIIEDLNYAFDVNIPAHPIEETP